MKKIALVDADLIDNGTRHPNLALMKLSGYFKARGDNVVLLYKDFRNLKQYDKIYVSKVFNYTKISSKLLKSANVSIGGTGFFEDGGEDLPDEIEHHMPDYELYNEFVEYQVNTLGKKRIRYNDYLNYSIGFMSRGCFRKCSFCVNKKYDRAFRHAHLSEFLDESKKAIYLWDDNFLACSEWREILDELEASGKPFQFRQGIDIRLLTDEKAERLSRVKYHGDFIFAFDHIEDAELISRKLEIWRRHTSKTTKLYVLCAYTSQDHVDIENVFKRIKILMKFGCIPYIMRYESYNDSEYKGIYVQLARWCNQPQFYKKKSFREFCEANQSYHSNKQTNCAAYQAMLDFEQKHPDIAKKYFDMKLENENIYIVSYGFGRKYSNKLSCHICVEEQKTWVNAYNGLFSINEVIGKYFTQEMDLQCLTYKGHKCYNIPKGKIAKWLCQIILSHELDDIWRSILNSEINDKINQSNIPQFSKFSDGTIGALKLIKQYPSGVGFAQLGKSFDCVAKNEIARRKYGENHAKLATLLDLAVINNVGNTAKIELSVFARSLYSFNEEDKNDIITKLILRIPIIQKILHEAQKKKIKLTDYMSMLSKTTITRRMSNISILLDKLKDCNSCDILGCIDNIERK
ncbi:hypothetical protein AAEX28_15055 [Lentisphaerota bacterium WC36G]|nr:hypothetical protein LJT99_01810 [Lentisphaerae bacterium WC36]